MPACGQPCSNDALYPVGINDRVLKCALIDGFDSLPKQHLSTEALDAPQSSTTKPVGHFMFALLSFPKFIVAAVNGPAVGIGVTMLPHCDVAYAYESSGGIDDTRKGNVESSTATHTVAAEAGSATFWTPFFRLSIVPEFGSSVTLPEILVS